MHFHGCALDIILEERNGGRSWMHWRVSAIFHQRSVLVARRAFPGVAIREPARCEIHLKKCLN